METIKKTVGIVALTVSLLCSYQSYGQHRKTVTKTQRTYSKVNHRYRTQPVYRNPAYRYPRHYRVVRTLPRNHVRIVYRGLPYFYAAGVYYTTVGNEYVVVFPPRGFRITVLPAHHVRIVVGPTVYFYHAGVYYTETTTVSTESEGNYEVTQPPVGVTLKEIPDDAEEVTIDGKTYYDFNDVLYKKETNTKGEIHYIVVYVKSSDNYI